jgi:hypothetical protein
MCQLFPHICFLYKRPSTLRTPAASNKMEQPGLIDKQFTDGYNEAHYVYDADRLEDCTTLGT